MADQSDRVEAPALFVGRGLGATPEKIEELTQRARQVEKMRPAKPAMPFSAVLERAASATDGKEEETLDPKEAKKRALPRKGPRPSLVHPSQREVYGREDGNEESVVLKG